MNGSLVWKVPRQGTWPPVYYLLSSTVWLLPSSSLPFSSNSNICIFRYKKKTKPQLNRFALGAAQIISFLNKTIVTSTQLQCRIKRKPHARRQRRRVAVRCGALLHSPNICLSWVEWIMKLNGRQKPQSMSSSRLFEAHHNRTRTMANNCIEMGPTQIDKTDEWWMGASSGHVTAIKQ